MAQFSGIGETAVPAWASSKYQDRRLAERVSSWRGRTARWFCGRSMPPRQTRSSMGALPARSSTPTPRCVPLEDDIDLPFDQAGRPAPCSATCRSCSCRLEPANIELVRQLVQAHAYWRLKDWRWTGDLD